MNLNKRTIVGFIIIILIYTIIAIQYPELSLQHQRELLLGKGEIPFGALSFSIVIFLWYTITKRNA